MPFSPETLDRLGVPAHLRSFEPTREAALARAARAEPGPYARTRNRLDGAVTGLSPYLTHGLVTLPEVAAVVDRRHGLGPQDKLASEFGWREFFHHAWAHAGDAILEDMRPTLPWPGRYADAVPADVREGRTGVPAIDAAVRVLYATGYLHNHARLWLASYLVHLRKVRWRAGADWLWGHLLDGDLASNHLGWQWVAGSFSAKPYLFNARNVAAFAPAGAAAAWDSTGTVIDAGDEALAGLAYRAADLGPQRPDAPGVAEPSLLAAPPAGLLAGLSCPLSRGEAPDTAGRPLELVHPWALGPGGTPGAFRLGVVHLPAHVDWPWSERRWRFMLGAMAASCDAIWLGDLHRLHLARRPATATACAFPGYRQAWASLGVQARPVPRLFAAPPAAARSFSAFWRHAGRHAMGLPGEGQSRHG
ncbi:FAD-binding domain-containing protein [Ramlibacter sp. MAHUQ-53]|uniref:FAD-binding domain-containing protein n=1 Tax=unclassified Ramlibacter TaxID=2617605 RepID=UPI00363C7C35